MIKDQIVAYLEGEVQRNEELRKTIEDTEYSLLSESSIIEQRYSLILFDTITVDLLRELLKIVRSESDPVFAVAKCLRHLSIVKDHIEGMSTMYNDLLLWVCKDLNDGMIDILDPEGSEKTEESV